MTIICCGRVIKIAIAETCGPGQLHMTTILLTPISISSSSKSTAVIAHYYLISGAKRYNEGCIQLAGPSMNEKLYDNNSQSIDGATTSKPR